MRTVVKKSPLNSEKNPEKSLSEGGFLERRYGGVFFYVDAVSSPHYPCKETRWGHRVYVPDIGKSIPAFPPSPKAMADKSATPSSFAFALRRDTPAERISFTGLAALRSEIFQLLEYLRLSAKSAV